MKAYFQKFSPQELPEKITCHTVHGQGRPVIATPHWHPEIECYLMLSGRCTVQVAQRRFTAETGDLIVVNRDQLHALYSIGDTPCSYLLLIFDYDSVVNSRQESSLFQQNVPFDNPLTPDTPCYRQLSDIFFALLSEQESAGKGQTLIRHGLVHQFCGLLVRSGQYGVAVEVSSRLDRSRVMLESTFQLIHDQYASPLPLAAAARAASLSVPQFCRLFRKTTGMTFNDYLSYYRVRKACKLLKADATLDQAAHECGFGSTASMIRCFHKFFQAAPKAYVKGL